MPLGPFIREAAGADSVTVEDGNLLTGGAIQENRALTVIIHGGAFNGTHQMVLRAEATATIAESRPLDQQFAFLKAADAGGVMVPKPTGTAAMRAWGKPFYLMQRIDGEALGIGLHGGRTSGPSRRARYRTSTHSPDRTAAARSGFPGLERRIAGARRYFEVRIPGQTAGTTSGTRMDIALAGRTCPVNWRNGAVPPRFQDRELHGR